jgi:hypothetical protein
MGMVSMAFRKAIEPALMSNRVAGVGTQLSLRAGTAWFRDGPAGYAVVGWSGLAVLEGLASWQALYEESLGSRADSGIEADSSAETAASRWGSMAGWCGPGSPSWSCDRGAASQAEI